MKYKAIAGEYGDAAIIVTGGKDPLVIYTSEVRSLHTIQSWVSKLNGILAELQPIASTQDGEQSSIMSMSFEHDLGNQESGCAESNMQSWADKPSVLAGWDRPISEGLEEMPLDLQGPMTDEGMKQPAAVINAGIKGGC